MAGNQDPTDNPLNPLRILVVPLVGIMFLLLFFLMLGTDMSQRVTEDSNLPNRDSVKEDPNKKEGYETTAMDLVGEREDWHVVIAGHDYIDREHLKIAPTNSPISPEKRKPAMRLEPTSRRAPSSCAPLRTRRTGTSRG